MPGAAVSSSALSAALLPSEVLSPEVLSPEALSAAAPLPIRTSWRAPLSVQAVHSDRRPYPFPPSIVPNQSNRRYHGGATLRQIQSVTARRAVPQMEQAKGRERLKAAPWQRFYPAGLDQFAALLAGL